MSRLIHHWLWAEVKNFYRTGVRDYFRCTSLRFILHGLFLMLAISFFFSSTSSISLAISPSDIDSSSSESVLESVELEEKREKGGSVFVKANTCLNNLFHCLRPQKNIHIKHWKQDYESAAMLAAVRVQHSIAYVNMLMFIRYSTVQVQLRLKGMLLVYSVIKYIKILKYWRN